MTQNVLIPLNLYEGTGVMEMPPINKEDAEKINLVLSEALESSKGLVPKRKFY